MPGDRRTSERRKRQDDAKSRAVEHDQDSEAPRTAEPPEPMDKDNDTGRQDGC